MVQILGTTYVAVSLSSKEDVIDLNSEENKTLHIKIPISYFKIKGILN